MFRASALPTDAGTIAAEFQTLSAKDLVIGVAVTQYCPDATSVVEVVASNSRHRLGRRPARIASPDGA